MNSNKHSTNYAKSLSKSRSRLFPKLLDQCYSKTRQESRKPQTGLSHKHRQKSLNISKSNLTMYNKHVNQVDFIPGSWARRLHIVKDSSIFENARIVQHLKISQYNPP